MPEIGELDLSYVAGLFDGEGYISLVKRVPCKTYYLVVGINMTDEAIMRRMASLFDGSVSVNMPKKEGWLPLWRWVTCTRQAAKFLEAILPYLRVKKLQADLALVFQAHKHSIGKRADEAYIQFEEACHARMKELKRLSSKGDIREGELLDATMD